MPSAIFFLWGLIQDQELVWIEQQLSAELLLENYVFFDDVIHSKKIIEAMFYLKICVMQYGDWMLGDFASAANCAENNCASCNSVFLQD
jgi:hypothetical protein